MTDKIVASRKTYEADKIDPEEQKELLAHKAGQIREDVMERISKLKHGIFKSADSSEEVASLVHLLLTVTL